MWFQRRKHCIYLAALSLHQQLGLQSSVKLRASAQVFHLI
jgi:hypothetical protein